MATIELTDMEQEEIARLIKEGYTSGRLDDEEGISVSWELKYEKWADDEE
jgi:DNA-binding CsgD family transcriptional regulator